MAQAFVTLASPQARLEQEFRYAGEYAVDGTTLRVQPPLSWFR